MKVAVIDYMDDVFLEPIVNHFRHAYRFYSQKKPLTERCVYWYSDDSFHEDGEKPSRLTNGMMVDDEGNLRFVNTICHKNDQFVKKQGRGKVLARILDLPKFNTNIPRRFDYFVVPVVDLVESKIDEETGKEVFYVNKEKLRDRILGTDTSECSSSECTSDSLMTGAVEEFFNTVQDHLDNK